MKGKYFGKFRKYFWNEQQGKIRKQKLRFYSEFKFVCLKRALIIFP